MINDITHVRKDSSKEMWDSRMIMFRIAFDSNIELYAKITKCVNFVIILLIGCILIVIILPLIDCMLCEHVISIKSN